MRYCLICERTYADEVTVCEVDGSVLSDPSIKQDLLIGKIIRGRYRVIEKLGEGGMGSVYLAEQIAINRKVALKNLHPEYARDQDFVRRFRQEAKLAASLNHRNIITVFDFDQADDGSLYIVMEYVAGRSLSEVIQDNPMELSQALRLGIQIAEGLNSAHRAGVIHRDIKPDNIMVLEGNKEIKLMDFGIARLRDSAASTRLTQTGMIMGTPAYMSPEQIEGSEVSERTDIYAFGIVLYEMLTGSVPFRAATPGAVLVKHLHENPLPVSKIRNGVPVSVERVVNQALQKNPERRFATMDEVAEALRECQRDVEEGGVRRTRDGAMRRGFGAVVTPFRRIFEKVSSGGHVRRSGAKPQADNDQDIQAPTLAPLESVDLKEGLHEPPAEERASPVKAGQPAAAAESVETFASPAPTPSAETIVETIALTRSLDIEENVVQQRPPDGNDSKDGETVAREASLSAAIDSADLRRGVSADGPYTHPTEVGDSQLQPETEPSALGTEADHQPKLTAAMTEVHVALPNQTILETAGVTQPVEEPITTQKRRWIFAAAACLLLVLAAALGVNLHRKVPVEQTPDKNVVAPAKENAEPSQGIASSPPTMAPGKIAAEESDTPQTSATTASAKVTGSKAELQGKESAPVIAPSGLTNEKTRSNASPPIAVEAPSTRHDKKAPTAPETVAVKKSQTVISKDNTPGDIAKTATSDREQRPLQKPVTAPEKTEASDSGTKVASLKPSQVPPPASKKTREPSGQQITSLPQPETPTPIPAAPRVELKNLSIIAKKRDLSVPERVILIAKGKYSDGSEMDIRGGVEWKSSDSSVASVSSRGEVQALKEGTTQISATYQGVLSSTYTFNVKGTEENLKPNDAGEQIKDIRRRLLR